jgi:hypothetical protein
MVLEGIIPGRSCLTLRTAGKQGEEKRCTSGARGRLFADTLPCLIFGGHKSGQTIMHCRGQAGGPDEPPPLCMARRVRMGNTNNSRSKRQPTGVLCGARKASLGLRQIPRGGHKGGQARYFTKPRPLFAITCPKEARGRRKKHEKIKSNKM